MSKTRRYAVFLTAHVECWLCVRTFSAFGAILCDEARVSGSFQGKSLVQTHERLREREDSTQLPQMRRPLTTPHHPLLHLDLRPPRGGFVRFENTPGALRVIMPWYIFVRCSVTITQYGLVFERSRTLLAMRRVVQGPDVLRIEVAGKLLCRLKFVLKDGTAVSFGVGLTRAQLNWLRDQILLRVDIPFQLPG